MKCRVCFEPEQILRSAEEAGRPDLLIGLPDRGLQNRPQQKDERIKEGKARLAKHEKACVVPVDSGISQPAS